MSPSERVHVIEVRAKLFWQQIRKNIHVTHSSFSYSCVEQAAKRAKIGEKKLKTTNSFIESLNELIKRINEF